MLFAVRLMQGVDKLEKELEKKKQEKEAREAQRRAVSFICLLLINALERPRICSVTLKKCTGMIVFVDVKGNGILFLNVSTAVRF